MTIRSRPSLPRRRCSVAVVARMIEGKGIADAVAAVTARARARCAGRTRSLRLARSIEPAFLLGRRPEQMVRRAGHPLARAAPPTSPEVWRTHHVAMLLTWYREGVPRSLIEAAASGRPIITTDSPGCRDLVRDRREGMLVPLRDTRGRRARAGGAGGRSRPAGAAWRGSARPLCGPYSPKLRCALQLRPFIVDFACNLLIQNVFRARPRVRVASYRAAC